ncbi:MAG: hypothetical protein ACRD20_05375 [Terriglobales bacterium]
MSRDGGHDPIRGEFQTGEGKGTTSVVPMSAVDRKVRTSVVPMGAGRKLSR